ncbi:MAG: formate dehydrogenase accessory sulfurtransferase FdhD [Acidimicrobiales bacterium]
MVLRGRVQQVLVHRAEGELFRRQPDELIVEEPLAIQLDGTLVATTMRTPGHDFELAAGFCHSEGLLGGATVLDCRYCAPGPLVDAATAPVSRASESSFNVVTVSTGGQAPPPRVRLGVTTSACGLCGDETLAELSDRLAPLPPRPGPDRAELARWVALVEQVRPRQELFARTGAVHAAAAFDADGTVLVVREDIGRHNALDKVIGHLLLAGRLPAQGMGVFVSSRASFEMVQKAWAGGFDALVAVSGPSALAVATARRANLALAGFVRDGRLTLYSPEM